MKTRALLVGGLLALSALGLTQGGGPEPGVLNLIRKIVNATNNLEYSGTRVVELKFGPDRVKHIEFVLRRGFRTRIEFPDDGSYRGQIIVETERERRHYFPDKNQIEIMPPRREELTSRLVKMLKKDDGIRITRSNGPTILGIDTQVIQIANRSGKLFQKLWIDPQTFLILKRELYDPNGQVFAASEFTKLDYRPRFRRSDFILDVPGAKRVTPRDHLAEMVAKGGFQNVSLPPKDPFKLESSRIQRIDDVSALVQVYVNADGRLSLYQLKTTIDPDKLRRLARGDTNVHSWEFGGSSFILMGDLPQEALRAIAERINR